MAGETYIPYREIAKAMEIPKGEILLLTSDILKLAMKARKKEREFNTGEFLNSFVEALGVEGTLLLPSYNFDLESGDSFHASKTIPMTGSLAVTALGEKDFIRTCNPLHSFLVKGKEAATLAAMQNVSSFGVNSPFAWLYEHNALMVFAGTTPAEAMTFTHFVEESEQVWYRKFKKLSIMYTDTEGQTSERVFRIYAKKAGWTMQMQKLETLFPAGTIRINHINGIPFYAIRCRDAYDVVSRDIKENNAHAIASFSLKLYFRDILKTWLKRFILFRTTYGKIRSAKRIH